MSAPAAKAPVQPSPWMTRSEAAIYLRRCPDFIMVEINAGRLKAARVGSKRQVLTCTAWCDEWVTSQTAVHPFRPKRV